MTTNEPIRNDEITLNEMVEKIKGWFNFLLSKWKTIVLAGMIGGLLGIGYSYTIKPVYTASLTFALEDNKSGGAGGVLSLASQFGISLGDSGGSIFEGSNLNELFKSRKMVEQTLLTPVEIDGKIISLAEMYIQNAKWRKNWEEKPKLATIQFLPNSNRKNLRACMTVFWERYMQIYRKIVCQSHKRIKKFQLSAWK